MPEASSTLQGMGSGEKNRESGSIRFGKGKKRTAFRSLESSDIQASFKVEPFPSPCCSYTVISSFAGKVNYQQVVG